MTVWRALCAVCVFCLGCAEDTQTANGVPDLGLLESDQGQLDSTITSDMALAEPQDQAVVMADTQPTEPTDAFVPLNAACEDWQAFSSTAMVGALHRHLSSTYRPITPTPNFGGQPDRYTTARQLMFTRVARYQNDENAYEVSCIYTNDTAFAPPDRDPDDEAINCEHVWPRARLDDDRSSALYEHQQSDIHHLAPTRPEANSLRGSLSFGDVVRDENRSATPSLAGLDQRGDRVFEPQDPVKGDIARIIFYMSIRWGLAVSRSEESTLRNWHRQDPVNMDERDKNDVIESLQGNRNPFIDCPELVERIDDFEAFAIEDTSSDLPFP